MSIFFTKTELFYSPIFYFVPESTQNPTIILKEEYRFLLQKFNSKKIVLYSLYRKFQRNNKDH